MHVSARSAAVTRNPHETTHTKSARRRGRVSRAVFLLAIAAAAMPLVMRPDGSMYVVDAGGVVTYDPGASMSVGAGGAATHTCGAVDLTDAGGSTTSSAASEADGELMDESSDQPSSHVACDAPHQHGVDAHTSPVAPATSSDAAAGSWVHEAAGLSLLMLL